MLTALGVLAVLAVFYLIYMPPLRLGLLKYESHPYSVKVRAFGWIFEEIMVECADTKTVRWWTSSGYVSYTTTLSRGAYKEEGEWGDEEILFESHPRVASLMGLFPRSEPRFRVTAKPGLANYRLFHYRDGYWYGGGGPEPLPAELPDNPPLASPLPSVPAEVTAALERGRSRFGKWAYGDRVTFAQKNDHRGIAAVHHLEYQCK